MEDSDKSQPTTTSSSMQDFDKPQPTKASSSMEDFDKPERAKALSVIDKLREIGVGSDISLPQVR